MNASNDHSNRYHKLTSSKLSNHLQQERFNTAIGTKLNTLSFLHSNKSCNLRPKVSFIRPQEAWYFRSQITTLITLQKWQSIQLRTYGLPLTTQSSFSQLAEMAILYSKDLITAKKELPPMGRDLMLQIITGLGVQCLTIWAKQACVFMGSLNFCSCTTWILDLEELRGFSYNQ